MSAEMILLPLFVEVILTFALLFWLGPLRARDFRTGLVREEDIALRQPNWSKPTLQVQRFLAGIGEALCDLLAWEFMIDKFDINAHSSSLGDCE